MPRPTELSNQKLIDKLIENGPKLVEEGYFCKIRNEYEFFSLHHGLPICSSACYERLCPYNENVDPIILDRVALTNDFNKRLRKRRVINAVTITGAILALLLIALGMFLTNPSHMSKAQLLEQLNGNNNAAHLRAAIELAVRKEPVALPVLESFLESESWEERRDSAKALGQLGDKQALPVLYTHLNDNDPDVLKEITIAITSIGGSTSVEQLLLALSNKPRNERGPIATAFCTIHDERSIPFLLEALNSDDIVTEHVTTITNAIINQGETVIPLLIDSMVNGGPGAAVLSKYEQVTNTKITQLREAMDSRDLEMLSRIYLFFLYLDEGLNTSDAETLASALLAYGDKTMATVFINFEGDKWIFNNSPTARILNNAAEKWAQQNGYAIEVIKR
jgi:hypothetical protein